MILILACTTALIINNFVVPSMTFSNKKGVPYAIFRPTGLNDDWPTNSRPVFSQGDVAVGRIHRKDVSKILSDCLTAPEAVGEFHCTNNTFAVDYLIDSLLFVCKYINVE